MGWCCLGKVDLLMAGGAAEVLLISRSCPLPLLRSHSPLLLFFCFLVFAEMGATSTASGRLEVNLLLFGKRGGKSHFGLLIASFSGIRGLKILPSQPLAAAYIDATKQDPKEPSG